MQAAPFQLSSPKTVFVDTGLAIEEFSKASLEPTVAADPSESALETGGGVTFVPEASDGYTEPYMEPSSWTTLTPGDVSSGPSDTRTPIPFSASAQDQESVTSNPVVTDPQSSVIPVIHNPLTQSSSSILQQASSSLVVSVTRLSKNLVAQSTISTNNISPIPAPQPPDTSRVQSTSSSSSLATAVTQLPNEPMSQTPSSINQQTSSTFNTDTPPTQPQHLSFNTVTQNIPSMGYQTSSSSNSNPSQILPSDSMLTDHPSTQILPATTLAVVPSPLAIPIMVPEVTASSAVGLANAILAGMGVLPPEASATPGQVANGALESGGNGVEVVQIFPTNTIAVAPFPTDAQSLLLEVIISSGAGLGDATLAGIDILPPEASATPGEVANGAIGSLGKGVEVVQIFPTTSVAVAPFPTDAQSLLLEVIISSAAGLGDAILAGMGIVPPGASATPGETANGALDVGGNGVEVVQIFPTTTLIVSTISSVTAAPISTVGGPIVPISAGMSIVSPGTSAVQSGGNGGGGVNESSLVTGSGSTTRSDNPTESGNPTESVSGHSSVPIVPTGGAEGATRWESWWLELGILVWGVGMVFWM